jgi:hypothetical protein
MNTRKERISELCRSVSLPIDGLSVAGRSNFGDSLRESWTRADVAELSEQIRPTVPPNDVLRGKTRE